MNYMILFTVLYGLIFALVYFSTIKTETKPSELGRKFAAKDYLPYALGLLAIFVVQLFAAQILPGHKQDAGLFRAWTSFGNEHHIWEFYKTDLYVDYPPVYLYILFGIGKVAKLFGVAPDSAAYLSFIKFIPILCDAITSIFIFQFARDKVGVRKAAALAFLSAINPANILNSTVWGQVDSFVTLLMLVMLFSLYNRNYVLSCAMFALSFLTKPQMIIFAPLIGFTIFFDLFESFDDRAVRKKMFVQIGLSILAFAAVLLLVPLPITGEDYGILIENYTKAMGLYPYATLNAANLYGAIGGNWAEDTSTFLFLNYKIWGFIFIVAMSLLVGYVTYKVKDRKKIFYLGGFTVATIYMFAHNMHERYLYSLFILLMVLFIFTKDKRMLLLYGAFSITNFINCGQVLIQNLKDDFVYGDNTLFILLSWIQLVLYFVMVCAWYQMVFKNRYQNTLESAAKNADKKKGKTDLKAKRQPTISIQKESEPVRFNRKDILIMLALSLFYSIFAFFQLGSHNVPETGWYPETDQESVVVDLGETQEIKQIYAFAGWIDRRHSDSEVIREITIEVSDDNISWRRLGDKMELSEVFHWKVTPVEDVSARYIRLTPDDGRFYINELAFYGDSEDVRFYPSSVISGNETAKMLIDEQDKVVYEFSWYDGTYFDEIYHPRTAYENITHRYPYENTHPPLGKLIIAAGMLLFGVNPFGWRFFGTLCGVLMVPLAYMMGKKMFKTSFFAFCTAFIFTFDFMHLSQTRLATIDSYTTFFVMGMFYFMYQYISTSFYNVGLKKTLRPLFLSGICFGLGAATKWQGIYAGFGLAALFFISLGRRYLEYRQASKMNKRDEQARHIVNTFRPMAIKTLLFATLFFVIIPGVIYFLSYIPAMNTESTGLSFFFTNQPSMYNYHSSLVDDHPYGSAWWSWPLDMKPLYAYSPNRSFVPEGMSMGISSFGNPFVWWLSIPVIIGGIYMLVKRRGGNEMLTILLGFAAMYLPWVLVPRVAFIYHYFPNVIFVVLGIVYFMKYFTEQNPKEKKYIYVYLAAVFVLFIMFYPVLTGMEVPTAYVNTALRWLPTWVLG